MGSEQDCAAQPYAAAFAQGLLDPSRPAPAVAVAMQGKRVSQRYDVYRNNVTVSLIAALAAIYPAVQRIIGADFFRAMARFHVRETPPKSPLLFEYGRDFPAFIGTYAYARDMPWLADVAHLERAWLDAYHAADLPVLSAQALAALAPASLADVRFVPHPAARVVRSDYPALAIFAMNRADAPVSPLQCHEAQDALVSRPGHDVVVSRLPEGGATFLAELLQGAPWLSQRRPPLSRRHASTSRPIWRECCRRAYLPPSDLEIDPNADHTRTPWTGSGRNHAERVAAAADRSIRPGMARPGHVAHRLGHTVLEIRHPQVGRFPDTERDGDHPVYRRVPTPPAGRSLSTSRASRSCIIDCLRRGGVAGAAGNRCRNQVCGGRLAHDDVRHPADRTGWMAGPCHVGGNGAGDCCVGTWPPFHRLDAFARGRATHDAAGNMSISTWFIAHRGHGILAMLSAITPAAECAPGCAPW